MDDLPSHIIPINTKMPFIHSLQLFHAGKVMSMYSNILFSHLGGISDIDGVAECKTVLWVQAEELLMRTSGKKVPGSERGFPSQRAIDYPSPEGFVKCDTHMEVPHVCEMNWQLCHVTNTIRLLHQTRR